MAAAPTCHNQNSRLGQPARGRTFKMRRLPLSLALLVVALGVLQAQAPQPIPFLAVTDVRPGMVGTGKTIFAGNTLEDFRAEIIGVLHNVLGPGRNLILARLDGGPLAQTGVIRGMSGSPVYVDGRLIGAVSYSLGSFAKEALAGITPIGEMTSAVDFGGPRVVPADLALDWPASHDQVMAALTRVAHRAEAPLGSLPRGTQVIGPASLAALAPALRPIGAAMVLNGFDPAVSRDLAGALPGLAAAGSVEQTARPVAARSPTLRPGDPVGMSLVRGDLEMGATGTVTHVDGSRVYAFGHPFLNLGPTSFAMTEAHVHTVLPSLDSSMKIASLGNVIGTMTQDRATAVAGTLGAGPKELEVRLTLTSERAPARRFTFYVLQDPSLTPLFSHVALLNALVAHERQTGAASIAVRGSLSFGADGALTIDDFFSGDLAIMTAAAAVSGPMGVAMENAFRRVMPETLDLELRTSERREEATIERAWLDTTRPHFGDTHVLQVQLREFRGGTRVISLPVRMPSQASGPLKLLVSDAATLSTLEARELQPGQPTTWRDLLGDLNDVRRNNRLYVRLISTSTGTVVGGDTLPALPASVRSILDADTSVTQAPVAKTLVGAWDERLDVLVRGARELTLTLTPRP
jgi:hypothetical protein